MKIKNENGEIMGIVLFLAAIIIVSLLIASSTGIFNSKGNTIQNNNEIIENTNDLKQE